MKGQFLIKCDFSYSCAAADKISTDLRARAVSLRQLSYLCRLDALPATQPTESKRWRQYLVINVLLIYRKDARSQRVCWYLNYLAAMHCANTVKSTLLHQISPQHGFMTCRFLV